MPGAPCLDGDERPPVEADEVPAPVRWALPEPWESATPGKAPGFHLRELLRHATEEPSEPHGGIESGGTTVTKRYVFGCAHPDRVRLAGS